MKHFSVLDHPIRHSRHWRPPALDLVLNHGNSFTVTRIRLQFPFCLNFRHSWGATLGLRIHLSASLHYLVTLRANVILSIRVRTQFWDICVRGQFAYSRREVGGHSTGGCGQWISLQQCRLTFAKNVGLCSYFSTSFSYNLVPLPTCISAHNLRYFTCRLPRLYCFL
jgi:hypothetical protein